MYQNLQTQNADSSYLGDFLKWVKVHSPAIDFAVASSVSFAVPYLAGANMPFVVGAWTAATAFDAGKNYVHENTDLLKNDYLKAFVDNLSGTALIYATFYDDNATSTLLKSKWGAVDTKEVQGDLKKALANAEVKAAAFGLQAMGQVITSAQLSSDPAHIIEESGDRYSFDNSLFSLRFGSYFFIKTMMSDGLFGGSLLGKAVSGMTASFIAKSGVKFANYLMNAEKDADFFYGAVVKDSIAAFINSGLYGLHDAFDESLPMVLNIAVDANIEAIDAVVRRDVLGNNKEAAVFDSVYDFAHNDAFTSLKDAASSCCDWVWDNAAMSMYQSKNDTLENCFDTV